MTLEKYDELKIAYKLLPPPLSALPAKYWTSISLWLHSYTVGRTFEELLHMIGDDSLTPEEAFIVGFLHDLAQKLGKSEESLRATYKWVLDKLVNKLKWSPSQARKIAKALETNPAENIRSSKYTDSLLPSRTWKLLMLADELQGSSDAISWALKVKEVVEKDYGTNIEISVYAVNIPQPFLKARIWELIEEKISQGCKCLPIASLQGLVVLSRCKTRKITISWDEIIERVLGRNETIALDNETVEALVEHVNKGCPQLSECAKKKGDERKKCKESIKKNVYEVNGRNKRGKYSGALFPLPKDKYCKQGTKHERASTYELLLHYFGPKNASKLTSILLPQYAKNSLSNIEITGVSYGDGDFICPVCGAKHPEGFVAGIVGDIIGVKSEKWSRFLPITISKSLNQALRETSRVRICPLCMLDILLNRQITQVSSDRQFSPYFTLSLQAPVPMSVLKEIAGLMHAIVRYTLSVSSLKDIGTISESINTLLKSPHSILSQVKTLERGALLDYGSLMISTNGAVRFTVSLSDLKLQDKLVFVAVAGLLGYYGVYPVTITLGYPPAVPASSNQLINYEVTYPLYGYSPSEKKYENCTPFVTAVLASIPGLYHSRDSPNERIRHVEEVLNFEPTHAPLLLLYSNPQVYSRVDRLMSMFLGVRGVCSGSGHVLEECRYDPRNPKPIDYYAYRLAAILSKRGGGSGYAYTKELRSALERVVNELDWLPDKDSWLSLLTQSEAPENLAPCKEAALCLLGLFEGLLRRFTDNAEKLPPGMRQVYANILVSAIERTARYPSNLPEEARQFKSKFFGLCPSGTASSSEENIEGGDDKRV